MQKCMAGLFGLLVGFVLTVVILYQVNNHEKLIRFNPIEPQTYMATEQDVDAIVTKHVKDRTDKRDIPGQRVSLSKFYKVWGDNITSGLKTMQTLKKIVLWTPFFGQDITKQMKCTRMKTCIFTADRGQIKDADAVVFHFWDTPVVYNASFMPSVRFPEQYWIWFSKESPEYNHNLDLISYSGVYNWTMTYRKDSDVQCPLGSSYLLYQQLHYNKVKKNSTKKSRLVAWVVSKCYKYFHRHIYAVELTKYLPIDVYGRCGKQVCDYLDMKCRFELIQPYKFYLAFESYRCKEYITEKFWHNALDQGVVPIVLGPLKSDYERLAPPNSFIHVDDFESPMSLARYIKMLDKDDTKYNQYFKWKMNPPKSIPQVLSGGCSLCAKLLDANPRERKVYTDLDRWWKGEHYEFCQPLVRKEYIWDKNDLVHY